MKKKSWKLKIKWSRAYFQVLATIIVTFLYTFYKETKKYNNFK